MIHKPAGLLAVATEREKEATAYHFLTEYQRAKEKGGRVFIVHRLDRGYLGGFALRPKTKKPNTCFRINGKRSLPFAGTRR